MINMIKEAFKTLIEISNIGKKDIERLTKILDVLDDEGIILKSEAIALTQATSKNAERSYDNFINRIKKEIADTHEESDNEEHKEMLSSMSIAHTKVLGSSYLVLKGKVVLKLVQTAMANKTYDTSHYVDVSGDTSRMKEIFISYSVANEGEKERFVSHLKKVLDSREVNYHLELWEMKQIPIGTSFDEVIKQRLEKADYGFILLSNNVLKSNYILDTELPHLLQSNKVFPIGLVGSINELIDTKNTITKRKQKKTANVLMGRNILLSKERTFFDKCINDSRREEFIEDVLSSLQFRIEYDEQKPDDGLNCVILEKKEYEKEDFFSDHKGVSTFIATATKAQYSKNNTLSVKIQDDLERWLVDKNRALYALLGEYGMGKTFNLRMFSHKLYDAYEKDKRNPFPFYIDLRDVESFVTTVDNIKRVRTIEEFISEVLRMSKNKHISATEILQMHQEGSVVLILDGLDEKLVHYNKEQQTLFFRDIVSVLTYQTERKYASKTILSCRNEYFESTAKQNSFLLGADRTNLKDEDYTALDILPLSKEDVESFLRKRISTEETARIMLYIESDNYLGSIATRPFMLGKIIELLPALMELETINTATFYATLIKDALGRDDEKHFIEERHKYTILKALAYYMFNNNTQSLSIDRLNEWFEDFIFDNPKLARLYSLKEDRHILEKDLRNSSLLVRFGDNDFGFSHSSIAEYFLAQYILEHYDMANHVKEVSELTRNMILESIENISDSDKKVLFNKCIQVAESKDSFWAKISLEIFFKLQFPIEQLVLSNLELQNFKFENVTIEHLTLYKCNLTSAIWKFCYIEKLIVENSILDESYFSHCIIENTELEGSSNVDITAYKSTTNLEIRHNYDSESAYKYSNVLGNTRLAPYRSIAYSPDGKKLLSSSSNNTLKIWCTLTGRCLMSLKGHTGWVNSIVYSPDGQTILSGSSDKTLKLWDATTGQCLKTLVKHSDEVNSVAYCPNGKTLLSASHDETVKLWDALSGKLLKTLIGHTSLVNSVAYSPNGKMVVSGSNDKTLKVWDITTGKCIKTLRGHNHIVESVSYSADGITLVSGSSDETLKLWDPLFGCCLKTIKGHKNRIYSVAYNNEGKILFSCSKDKTIKLWNASSGKFLQNLTKNCDFFRSLACSPDDTKLATISDNGRIRVIDLKTEKLEQEIIAVEDEWCSINDINKTAKGTPLSWKYMHLEKDGEKYYFSDMEGFEVCE